jgi:general secretion pathway protein H
MRTSAPGSRDRASACLPGAAPRSRGFTLLELLVVIAIIGVASAGVSFAVRNAGAAPLERDAQRLAALLESGRARSRLSGQMVRWVASEDAFRFEGSTVQDLPHAWLDRKTRVAGRGVLVLGPEPIIGPQEVVLTSADQPDRALRVVTDGLRPFTVDNGAP